MRAILTRKRGQQLHPPGSYLAASCSLQDFRGSFPHSGIFPNVRLQGIFRVRPFYSNELLILHFPTYNRARADPEFFPTRLRNGGGSLRGDDRAQFHSMNHTSNTRAPQTQCFSLGPDGISTDRTKNSLCSL